MNNKVYINKLRLFNYVKIPYIYIYIYIYVIKFKKIMLISMFIYKDQF